ncbi:methyltransferase [Clostridia bacterium]|nr:methyltransferase [Clostridia bacterium]
MPQRTIAENQIATNSPIDSTIPIKEGERLDSLQRNGYVILQHPKKFCFGMDAVLLSGFVKVCVGERVMDFCTGTGILPILLSAKTQGEHFTGLEILEESADMARRSVALNRLQDKISIQTGDVKVASALFPAASFHVVTVNPPYIIARHGIPNENPAKAIARHEILCCLEDVIRESAKLLVPNGRFYMVHKPFRLTEILCEMHRYGIEPKRLRFVHPFIDKEPNMVLVEGLRGGKSRVTVEPPLVVFRGEGVYTDEVQEMYGF